MVNEDESHAPTLDESAPAHQIYLYFVVSVAHAKEEEGKFDEILEDIRETVDQLDITEWIPHATFFASGLRLLATHTCWNKSQK
ncbi:hypothetical protein BLNAU_20220 [Blattamonas nauphoetae]|uniref:Uncharacterized protein n=1 Tax=Blattamonas nauphoetae TaxID=2049346 RepID=A0ABQ9X1S1_9EUKA|nr:hypothetical protein BLNAU_20220 [Blattamonas nauphoetae]